MKNRRASCIESYPHGNDFVTTIARVVPSRTIRLLDVIERVKYAAVILYRRLILTWSWILSLETFFTTCEELG